MVTHVSGVVGNPAKDAGSRGADMTANEAAHIVTLDDQFDRVQIQLDELANKLDYFGEVLEEIVEKLQNISTPGVDYEIRTDV